MKQLLIFLSLLFPMISNAQSDSIGIYIKTGNTVEKIRPLRHYKVKTNTLATAFTYGIAGAKIKTVFKNGYSNNKVTPESRFLFYFGDTSHIPTYYMFSNVYSPNDFQVVEFKTKTNKRELSVGKVNIYAGTEMGLDDSDGLKLSIKEIRPGLYELSFSEIPYSGEYCFVFSEMIGSGGYLPVFDFSVDGIENEYEW